MKIQELPAGDNFCGCCLSNSHFICVAQDSAEFTSKTTVSQPRLSALPSLDLLNSIQDSPSVFSLLPVRPNLSGVPPAVWHERPFGDGERALDSKFNNKK